MRLSERDFTAGQVVTAVKSDRALTSGASYEVISYTASTVKGWPAVVTVMGDLGYPIKRKRAWFA